MPSTLDQSMTYSRWKDHFSIDRTIVALNNNPLRASHRIIPAARILEISCLPHPSHIGVDVLCCILPLPHCPSLCWCPRGALVLYRSELAFPDRCK